jgi:signal transduction histidine kinase/CheY-like chemotaxis protein
MKQNDSSTLEILRSSARNLILTTSGLYLIWHFTAILIWPRIFSPKLWIIGSLFTVILFLVLRLNTRYYYLSQVIWLTGLVGLIILSYILFNEAPITLLITFIPLISILTIGPLGALIAEGLIIPLALFLYSGYLIPEIPYGYTIGIILGSIFTGLFGWGLSNNYLSALSSASYHYNEARRLLEETRQHRAQISLMLKDQHQANYQLERLNEMLQWARRHADEARAERDQFILAVSHELRSPLNFIIGFSDLMVNSPETYSPLSKWPPGLYEDIQQIYHSSTHLMRLINDILDLGQIDAKQMTLYREYTSFEQLLKDVQVMVEPAYRKKGLTLQVNCEPGLPSVFIDNIRIRQVLLNLLNNSLRFTDHGGVKIDATSENDKLLVCVTDTGTGISPEDIPKVFNEFLQVGQESWRRREGTGLGLAISKRFIQLHGGKMWVESTLGQGSQFYFTLPFHFSQTEASFSPDREQADIIRQPIKRKEDQRQIVLILTKTIDTYKAIRQLIDEYQLIHASDPESLSEQIINFLPRALLVDGSEPIEARELLKKIPYDLPVIYFTPHPSWNKFNKLPVGVTDYLVKPISRQAILDAVIRLSCEIHSILVVDDDPAMYRFVCQVMKSPPMDQVISQDQIYNAADGMQAMAYLEAYPVDLILLDIELPDIHGLDLLERIREKQDNQRIQVIVISATVLPNLSYYHSQMTFELILKQPLAEADLSTIIKKIIEQVPPRYPHKLTEVTLYPSENEPE